ncbi:large conductance mechanosensitive channel protein MscL [Tumebacillus flagellatus]|uniref:Large-conductance mechanosensitive channel n=1 Tax=Tumebacillus flagellatus TaxID=1157490 RepID=A0A074LV62_9BACL|nr:large conductance mechanosensitive channel protein MscL [Tumebacillus flagellatus]KEO83863.1 mechanosensitive ion channel protein MscL [Tumebacillus flagellatus]
MLKEFKEFALRGNLIDLAIGVIVGGAFQKIVTSLVNDVIMPPIGMLVGRVDFSDLFLSLDGGHYGSLAEAKKAGAATLNYGQFLNNVLDFLIVAFVIFLVVRQINRLKRKEGKPVTTKECQYCLSTIPLKATRCGHCTSELDEHPVA